MGQFRLSTGDGMSKKQVLWISEHFYEIVDFGRSLDLKLMRFKRFQLDEEISEGAWGPKNQKNESNTKQQSEN